MIEQTRYPCHLHYACLAGSLRISFRVICLQQWMLQPHEHKVVSSSAMFTIRPVPCSLPSCVISYVAGLAAAPHGGLPIVACGCVQGGRDGEIQQGKWLRGRQRGHIRRYRLRHGQLQGVLFAASCNCIPSDQASNARRNDCLLPSSLFPNPRDMISAKFAGSWRRGLKLHVCTIGNQGRGSTWSCR